MAAYQNEWQMFGADGLPFLATSYDDSMKLYKAQKPILEKKLAEQGMALLYTAVATPGHSPESRSTAADGKQPWRAYSLPPAALPSWWVPNPSRRRRLSCLKPWPPAWWKPT